MEKTISLKPKIIMKARTIADTDYITAENSPLTVKNSSGVNSKVMSR